MTVHSLQCQLSLHHVWYQDSNAISRQQQGETVYVCHPVIEVPKSNGRNVTTTVTSPFMYTMNLTGTKVEQDCRHRLLQTQGEDRDVFLSVPGGQLDEETASVRIPDANLLQILTNLTSNNASTSTNKSRRNLQQQTKNSKRSLGTLRVLVLRVITNDSEPSFSREFLYNTTFRKDAISFTSQMSKCSAQALTVEPVGPGVVNVPIDLNIKGIQYGQAVNAAYAAAPSVLQNLNYNLPQVDDVRQLVDSVLLVVPPGSKGSWAAYGSLNGKQSTYNDKWAGYLGGTMHEVGHNFGLLHSNEGGQEYEGKTGYMGSAPQQVDFPLKCYNGQNHWHLGWYQQHSRELYMEGTSSNTDHPLTFRVAAFVDHEKADASIYTIVIKVGDYYMQYNRAKSYNRNTSEKVNALTIVKYIPGVGTSLMAGLDWRVPYWEGTLSTDDYDGDKLAVEVCETVAGNDITPDYMVVSIGKGRTKCNSPTVIPTEAPVIATTPVPTRSPIVTYRSPTASPTRWSPSFNGKRQPGDIIPTANPTPWSPSFNGERQPGRDPSSSRIPAPRSPSMMVPTLNGEQEDATGLESPRFDGNLNNDLDSDTTTGNATNMGALDPPIVSLTGGQSPVDSGLSTVAVAMISLSVIVVSVAMCLCAWISRKRKGGPYFYWFKGNDDSEDEIASADDNSHLIAASALRGNKSNLACSRSTVSTDSSPERSRELEEDEQQQTFLEWLSASANKVFSGALPDTGRTINERPDERPSWNPVPLPSILPAPSREEEDMEVATNPGNDGSPPQLTLFPNSRPRVTKYDPVDDLGGMVRMCNGSGMAIEDHLLDDQKYLTLESPASVQSPPSVDSTSMQIISIAPGNTMDFQRAIHANDNVEQSSLSTPSSVKASHDFESTSLSATYALYSPSDPSAAMARRHFAIEDPPPIRSLHDLSVPSNPSTLAITEEDRAKHSQSRKKFFSFGKSRSFEDPTELPTANSYVVQPPRRCTPADSHVRDDRGDVTPSRITAIRPSPYRPTCYEEPHGDQPMRFL